VRCRRGRGVRILAAILALLVTASIPSLAVAHPPIPEGVSELPSPPGEVSGEQREAVAVFARANAYMRDGLFVEAVAAYRVALTHWDHPAIHFNLALALINLDDPITLADELDRALAYGAAPLGDEHFERATQYRALVAKMLVHVELTLDVTGAELYVDDAKVFVGPGTWKATLRAGRHAVRATAKGKMSYQSAEFMEGDTTVVRTIELYELIIDDFGHRQPLPRWVGYTVFAAGVATIWGGFLFHVSARGASDDYDQQLAACPVGDDACRTAPELLDLRTSAAGRRGAAFALYGGGAALAAVGIAICWYERRRFHRQPDPDDDDPAAILAPVVGDDVIGVAALGHF
jgi:hypothetical protein